MWTCDVLCSAVTPQSASCHWSCCCFRSFFQLCWNRVTPASGSKRWSTPGLSLLDMSCRLETPRLSDNSQYYCTNSWLSNSDLHSYLLGDHEDEDNQINNNLAGRHNNNRFLGLGEGLHAAHQAILMQGGSVAFRSYHRPINFPLKVCAEYNSSFCCRVCKIHHCDAFSNGAWVLESLLRLLLSQSEVMKLF